MFSSFSTSLFNLHAKEASNIFFTKIPTPNPIDIKFTPERILGTDRHKLCTTSYVLYIIKNRAWNQNPELVEIMKNTHIKNEKLPQKTWHRFTIEFDYVEQTMYMGWVDLQTYMKGYRGHDVQCSPRCGFPSLTWPIKCIWYILHSL